MRRVTGSTLVVALLLTLAWGLPPAASADVPQIVVTKTTTTPTTTPGSTVDYEITLENTGDTGVFVGSVNDELPEGFTYVSGSTGGGFIEDDPLVSGGVATWQFDTPIPGGEQATVSFLATAADDTGTYFNSATADAGSVDVQGSGPTAPVQLAYPAMYFATTEGDERVALEWTSNDPDAARYRLFYRPGTAPPAFGQGTEVTVAPGRASAEVTGLTNGTTYAFSVFALDAAGEVLQSAEATATPELPAVTGLVAAGAGTGSMELSWTNPAGVSEAVVRYSTSAFPTTPGGGTNGGTHTGGTATLSGLTNGTTYYVSVFARRGAAVADAATTTFAPFACSSLADAMDAPAGLVESSRWTPCVSEDAHTSASTLETPLPLTGATQAIMTTGDAAAAEPPAADADFGVDHGTMRRGAYDVSTHRMELDVPAGTKCLSFDYALATDEYPGNIGNGYADGFVAELDQSTWTMAGPDLEAPDTFALTPGGAPVTVDSGLFADETNVAGPDESGTGYDGFSRPLTASTPITPGAHTLFLSVFDGGDGRTDSAVFLDGLVLSDELCPGAEPAAVSAAIDRPRVVGPMDVEVTGQVTESAGNGLPGEDVTLWAQPAGGSWQSVGSVESGPDGEVSLTHRPARATTYEWRVGGLTSARVAVKVKPILSWFPPNKVKKNKKLVVTAGATPVDAGDTVLLQQKVRKRWSTVATATFRSGTTSTTSALTKVKERMTKLGKQTFRVRLPAQSGRLPNNGRPFVVRVTRR